MEDKHCYGCGKELRYTMYTHFGDIYCALCDAHIKKQYNTMRYCHCCGKAIHRVISYMHEDQYGYYDYCKNCYDKDSYKYDVDSY